MREARGNLLHMDGDALVITTNGFVKANGEAVNELSPSGLFLFQTSIHEYTYTIHSRCFKALPC